MQYHSMKYTDYAKKLGESSFTHFVQLLKLRILGLKAYWYTAGSAYHQIPQSYSHIYLCMHAYLYRKLGRCHLAIYVSCSSRQLAELAS